MKKKIKLTRNMLKEMREGQRENEIFEKAVNKLKVAKYEADYTPTNWRMTKEKVVKEHKKLLDDILYSKSQGFNNVTLVYNESFENLKILGYKVETLRNSNLCKISWNNKSNIPIIKNEVIQDYGNDKTYLTIHLPLKYNKTDLSTKISRDVIKWSNNQIVPIIEYKGVEEIELKVIAGVGNLIKSSVKVFYYPTKYITDRDIQEIMRRYRKSFGNKYQYIIVPTEKEPRIETLYCEDDRWLLGCVTFK